MKFKLDFEIEKQVLLSDFGAISLLGSCFAESQAANFCQSGFDTLSNPFGIFYNPISIARILSRLSTDNLYTSDDFILNEEQYFSLEHHGSCNYNKLEDAINSSNQILSEFKAHLEKSTILVLSFGTSLIYRHNAKNLIVANCHRLPSKAFTREQLSLRECVEAMNSVYKSIKELNPSLEIISTISPIRHIRSGIPQNNLSKSVLRVALEQSSLRNHYFPSFEIFMDELRDYRFSKEDFSHPTTQATTYIWERFKSTYFHDDLLIAVDDVEAFRKFEAHIPRSDLDLHQNEIELKRAQLGKKHKGVKL